jgi:hypothetical protein
VINPSGVDPTKPKPLLVRWVKELSPFASAIEALCIGEYPGVRFQFPKRGPFERVRNIPRMGGLALVTVGSNTLLPRHFRCQRMPLTFSLLLF